VDIRTVVATVGITVCRTLIGMHTCTGCATLSAIAGKGKASVYKLMTSNREIQEQFSGLSKEWDLSPEMMDKLEAFTFLLYGPKVSST